MYAATIAIVDATRARLFTLERESGAEGLRESFTERTDLVNPARRLRPSELFSDSRPGSTANPGFARGGAAYDDHREAHVGKLDTDFARDVIAEVDRVAEQSHSPRVILCASPGMLGELRKMFGDLHARVTIATLPRDLVRMGVAELRSRLTQYGLIPPAPARPAIAAR